MRGADFNTETPGHGYYIQVRQRSVAVEYVNRRWYYLEYKLHHNSYITQVDLALTKEQLQQHNLACEVQPPETNLLMVRLPSVAPVKDDNTPTKSGDKGKRPTRYDSSDKEDNKFHPAKGPLTPAGIPSALCIVTPQEIDMLSARIKHIATLAHADHPTDETTYL